MRIDHSIIIYVVVLILGAISLVWSLAIITKLFGSGWATVALIFAPAALTFAPFLSIIYYGSWKLLIFDIVGSIFLILLYWINGLIND